MLNELTRTYKTTSSSNNRIDVSIYYSRGGMNYFSGRPEPRGYYFSIQPYQHIDHGNGLISRRFTAFTGTKSCVLECERQSKKRFETACSMLDDLTERYLPSFLTKSFLELESNEYVERVSECRA